MKELGIYLAKRSLSRPKEAEPVKHIAQIILVSSPALMTKYPE